MISVVVSRVGAHTHKVLSSLSENGEGSVVVIIRAASLKKKLLRDFVVANKHRSVDTGFLRHATITPLELAFNKRKISVQASEPQLGELDFTRTNT